MAFIFSLISFLAVFSFKFIFSKEVNRIETVERESSEIPASVEVASSVSDAEIEKEADAFLQSSEAYPGEMVILKVKGTDNAEVKSDLLEGINLYPDGMGSLSALVPIRYDKEPGDYYIEVSGEDLNKKLELKVLPKEFPTQNIEVSSQTAKETVNSQKANDEYNQRLHALKWNNEDKMLWDGTFKKPLESYRITSDFGEIRMVNGRESGRHGGIDMAAPKGTPVYAPASGKVLFADFLTLTGNTIMIEHGFGLKTLYYHMDSLDVKQGDEVKSGDLLGKVGTTGFSTGPHLHFAVAVENIYVNPWSFFEKDYSKFINS